MRWSVASTEKDLARDRRLIPRLFLRVFLATASILSAWAVATGRPLPVLAGVEPGIVGVFAWSLAVVHLVLGVGLLVPPVRRLAVAGLVAALLGWMAFLGATSRYLPAFFVGVMVVLALRVAPPEDEGTWTLRRRSVVAEASWLLDILFMAALARFALGEAPTVLVPVAGAVLHERALERLKSPRRLAVVLLLWVLLFWIGFGGLWTGVGHALAGHRAAAVHLAFGVLGLLAFWSRNHLWTATAGARALFGYGAAAVYFSHRSAADPVHPGNVDFSGLVLGGMIMPTVMLLLAWRLVAGGSRSEGAGGLPEGFKG